MVDAGKNDHQHGKHSRLQQKLKQGKAGMRLGVNNDVNLGTKKAALQLMDGGAIKNKLAQQPPFKPNPQSRHGRAK